MPILTAREKKKLSFLMKPENKKKLNALLHVYETYIKIVQHYLDNINSPTNYDLNIFYMRELVPTIDGLVHDLKLDIKGESLILSNCIFSQTLFEIEKTGLDMGKSREYGAEFSRDNYGKIKVLVENAKAVLQEPIVEVEMVIERAGELINKSIMDTTKTSLKRLPSFHSDDKFIYVIKIEKQKRLFKLTSNPGALLEALKEGRDRTKEAVYEILQEKTGDILNGTQIDNAMKEINRALSKKGMPHLSLNKYGRNFQLVLKNHTKKHTV